MAWEIPGFTIPTLLAGGTAGTAGSDLSIPATVNSIALDSFRYMNVKVSGGLVVPVSAATDKSIGVLQNKPAPGNVCQIMMSGISRMRSNDAGIIIGSELYLDAFGMATTTRTGSSGPIGIAMEAAASANGFVIAVLLNPLGAYLT